MLKHFFSNLFKSLKESFTPKFADPYRSCLTKKQCEEFRKSAKENDLFGKGEI